MTLICLKKIRIAKKLEMIYACQFIHCSRNANRAIWIDCVENHISPRIPRNGRNLPRDVSLKTDALSQYKICTMTLGKALFYTLYRILRRVTFQSKHSGFFNQQTNNIPITIDDSEAKTYQNIVSGLKGNNYIVCK